MIVFNNIKITQNNKYLIIDAEIEDSVYYKDMYIDSVIIDNQDTYTQNGPSNNPIYTYKAQPQEDKSYSRQVHLVLDKTDLVTIENNMFFVYIIAGGTPSPDTPCGYDVNVALKVVVNTYPIYNTMMQYLKELSNKCGTPYSIIDKILQIKMLDASVQTGNNLKAIEIWNTYFKNKQEDINVNCGCNGRA